MLVDRRDFVALALIGSALPTLSLGAFAFESLSAPALEPEETYPRRPVTLVIGSPPGGGADALARILIKHLETELGQKMIIEYRPGAAGNIGAESVARALPDGYTIYLSAPPNTIHKAMYGHLDYDFSRDLVPIGLVATMPYVIVAGAHAPIATVQDIVRLAMKYPGALTCASTGVGSTSHLLCELLQQETGIDMLHVPYRGSALALTDVAGGRVDVQIAPVPATLVHIQSGKLRPLAVMSGRRVPALSSVPTLEEAGVPGLQLEAWYGLVAPKGTPSHVVAQLNRSINGALMNPALRDDLARLTYAFPSQPNTPQVFQNLLNEETERWNGILRSRNIRPFH